MTSFLQDREIKVARWKKLLCINSHHTANLNFLFLSLYVYLFKNYPSQFLSHWELAESVFFCEELSCLPYKNQTKAWLSVLWWENSNLLYGENLYLRVSSTEPPLSQNDTTLSKLSNAKLWETPRCKGKILRTHKVKLWQANKQALIWPLTTVFETVFLRTTTHQRAIEKLTLKWKWNSHFI